MRTYKVGYFVGSLSSTSINRVLTRALIRLAPDDLEFTEMPIGNLPLYSPDFDSDYPPEAIALKDAIAALGCGPVRHARVQPIDPGGVEERHRLGVAAVGAELVRPHAGRCHRGVDRADRHGGRPAEPARRAELLQRPADDRPRGLHPVTPGLFTDDGEVTDESTAAFLADFMREFRDHIERVLAVLPRS